MYQPSHQASEEESEEDLMVTRCLRGEDTAWETMSHHYHPRLVSIIKVEMNCQCSTEQAEEIATSVWCSLCGEASSRLRRYDPHAGRLLAYLAGLARREIWKNVSGERASPINGDNCPGYRGVCHWPPEAIIPAPGSTDPR